jgi:L-histidine N-alpha-methyltransferase
MNTQFAMDVKEGLSASPKRLSSKYFYDEEGDRIFQAIMEMPEYYLTRSEFEILEMNKKLLLELFKNGSGRFNLIEFGAGDGLKTKILLRYFTQHGTDFKYIPIDISRNMLNLLTGELKKELPELQVQPMQNDYFRALSSLSEKADCREVVLFLGSNIGNFSEEEAIDFLRKLSDNLNPGDLILIGFDLKKDPELVRKAYNDPAGITRAFNMNLLKRINRELGGDFDLQQFQHYQMYDPDKGEARSFLISRQKQEVHIAALEKSFSFEPWEPVHVEISRKYDLATIQRYADRTGFVQKELYYDCRHYYVNALWEKK